MLMDELTPVITWYEETTQLPNASFLSVFWAALIFFSENSLAARFSILFFFSAPFPVLWNIYYQRELIEAGSDLYVVAAAVAAAQDKTRKMISSLFIKQLGQFVFK